MSDFPAEWRFLTASPNSLLPTATQQLHHAAQLVAMVAKAFLPPKDDDSHTNLEWIPQRQAVAGNWITAKTKFRLAIVFPTFELQCWNQDYAVLFQFPLNGQTNHSAIAWIAKTLQTEFALPTTTEQLQSKFELPDNLPQDLDIFRYIDSMAFNTLADYYNNAHFLLQQVAYLFEHASPVRTWPHHFDIGVYIPLAFAENQEAIKSIGIGLAIPDEFVDDFYFYVNHWSKTGAIPSTPLPDLPAGAYWNTKGWIGGVLEISTLFPEPSVEAQATRAAAFFDAAITASLALIGESAS